MSKLHVVKKTGKFYYSIGAHYGFPLCCIESFDKGFHHQRKPIYKRLMYKTGTKNTGFIPCINHLILLAQQLITIQELLKDRVCLSPFPNGGRCDECNPKNRCTNW